MNNELAREAAKVLLDQWGEPVVVNGKIEVGVIDGNVVLIGTWVPVNVGDAVETKQWTGTVVDIHRNPHVTRLTVKRVGE